MYTSYILRVRIFLQLSEHASFPLNPVKLNLKSCLRKPTAKAWCFDNLFELMCTCYSIGIYIYIYRNVSNCYLAPCLITAVPYPLSCHPLPCSGYYLLVVGIVCAPSVRYEAELSSTRAALDDAMNQIALVSAVAICL